MVNLNGNDWTDVTREISVDMPHWPGDPDVEITRIADMSAGASCNVSALSFAAHTGTHIDAPVHYLPDGAGAESAPLHALMGRARVLECDDPVAVRQAWLADQNIGDAERIIFKTRESAAPTWQFHEDFVYIAADAAEYLARRRTLLVGIDSMSVGGFYDSMVETHVTLLQSGCWIVENLDLANVHPGDWEILCLPLKISQCDGAPARVLMRPL